MPGKLAQETFTWIENIKKISSFNKPLIIATGASQMIEVEQALQRDYKDKYKNYTECNVIQIIQLLKITLII